MSAGPLRVRFSGKWLALVSGHGSRELLMSLRNGKAPMWNATARAWATTPGTAADLIAIAESRGRSVIVTDDTRARLGDAQ